MIFSCQLTIRFALVRMKFLTLQIFLTIYRRGIFEKSCSNFDFSIKSKCVNKSIEQSRYVILMAVCLLWSTEEDFTYVSVTQIEILLRASVPLENAISKKAPKISLELGKRYLNIINSAFLVPPYRKSFANEIAPLKTHIPKTEILQFAQKASIF